MKHTKWIARNIGVSPKLTDYYIGKNEKRLSSPVCPEAIISTWQSDLRRVGEVTLRSGEPRAQDEELPRDKSAFDGQRNVEGTHNRIMD